LKVPVCKPIVKDTNERAFTVNGLYNPVVVLKQELPADGIPDRLTVLNNIEFDENGMIYILTGPNQGGKTVFTQAVGIAQLMFQLGLFVPATSAVISPVDHIFTHFQNHEFDSKSTGRFAEECQRLTGIFAKLTRNSLLLMDETFSSTSGSEASYIAEQVLLGLRAAGCRVIFATHLHDLARKIDELNESVDVGSRIDSLTAGLIQDPNDPGKRSYRITRTRPIGSSYARDIAEKYGLTLENLMATLGKQ
jgi:DNA mismatch repair protein MutS